MFRLPGKKKNPSPSPDYSAESEFSDDHEDAEDYRHGRLIFFRTHKLSHWRGHWRWWMTQPRTSWMVAVFFLHAYTHLGTTPLITLLLL